MCTGLTVNVGSGKIFARTMEFAELLGSKLLFKPKGQCFRSTIFQKEKEEEGLDIFPGMTWTSKYSFLGPNGIGSDQIVEGFNEKGLHVAAFMFPNFAEYVPAGQEEADESINPVDFVGWALSMCHSVEEVSSCLANHKVYISGDPLLRVGEIIKEMPFHWIVQDNSKAIVVEYTKSELNIYDNPYGVITNSPPFDWQTTNLRNYVNLTPDSASPIKLPDNVEIRALGKGSGMLGLPGDFTAPSRFVRAFALSQAADTVEEDEGVTLAWTLINNIDIPKGAVRGVDEEGKKWAQWTLWTSVSDLINLKYYFRTDDNQVIRVVDFNALLNKDKATTIPMDQDPSYEDVTPQPDDLEKEDTRQGAVTAPAMS